ncbi:sulfur carrier protein ThiS [Vibrio kasasachensis]|uniref:sulfur carrier protein ThiS n=1 Tax=Vibrio kasasachensis TaxID=2910248 RepID=UPI003D0CB87F
MTTMTILINQQPQVVAVDISLMKIITEFDLPDQGCVFAINNQVVPKSEWQTKQLNQGDAISLFQAIAGG